MKIEPNHLYLGDCLDLMPHIEDATIDMILCDLPYGTTACSWDTIIPLEPLWEQYKRIIKNNGAIVLTATQPFTTVLISSNMDMFRYCWVWNKKLAGIILNAKRQPLRITEDIVIFNTHTYNPQMRKGRYRKKGGYTKQPDVIGEVVLGYTTFNDIYYPVNLIEIPNSGNRKKVLHPTQKPVVLFEYLIKTYTNKGDLVLDNCIGSGTTAIAALNTNRRYIGMEKEQEYYNKAVYRVNNRQTKLT